MRYNKYNYLSKERYRKYPRIALKYERKGIYVFPDFDCFHIEVDPHYKPKGPFKLFLNGEVIKAYTTKWEDRLHGLVRRLIAQKCFELGFTPCPHSSEEYGWILSRGETEKLNKIFKEEGMAAFNEDMLKTINVRSEKWNRV